MTAPDIDAILLGTAERLKLIGDDLLAARPEREANTVYIRPSDGTWFTMHIPIRNEEDWFTDIHDELCKEIVLSLKWGAMHILAEFLREFGVKVELE